jgi:type I restriction enzyme M protein
VQVFKGEVIVGNFADAKRQFDNGLGTGSVLPAALVPVNGKPKTNVSIRNAKGEPLEEYFKWQFIYSLLYSGLYAKDYIGAEVFFPKGSKGANPLKIDAAIFDSAEWLQHYRSYWQSEKPQDLQWLNDHLLGVIEFKRDEKELEQVFTRQVKPAMREKEPSDAYVLAMYYDAGRLYLFHRRDGKYLRYDEAKNQKGTISQVGDLSLHLPDPYDFIPSFEELRARVHRPSKIDRTKRGIKDLEVISSIATVQMSDALSNVLRMLDKAGLVNQRGYEILIQTFALKIFDEKRNEKNPGRPLDFYIREEEKAFKSMGEKPIQQFIERIKSIGDGASGKYEIILRRPAIDWKDSDHVRAVAATCESFQDYSFVRSSQSDLYQLVFYNFANQFQQQEKAQFLTPLAVIDFLVKIVNPRNDETVFDPCCGIGDFLSLSYVNAQSKQEAWKLDDANIYGTDVSGEMITLASLNMLLNGDGKAHLFRVPDKGAIIWKIRSGNPPEPVELIPERHKAGNWDDWPDKTQLMKFGVILTNPPFGEDRSFRPRTDFERKVIEMYQTWMLSGAGDNTDLGVVFLENAYHCLKEEGRLAIVLSNSIASINRWQEVREWALERMRIVALFDLPANVFAETGVNTTLLVAYKPKPSELPKLLSEGYTVFVRDIKAVGYEKRTSKRNVYFKPVYRIDESTFEIQTDAEGHPVLDEDFTQALTDFKGWALGQEETLQRIFLREDRV